MALRATLVAGSILIFFAVFGDVMLRLFGITLPALRTAGGIPLTAGGTPFAVEWWLAVSALLAILVTCYVAMLVASPLQRLLGVTGLAVVSRVVGVLLAALSVQFLFDGIAQSGLLAPLAG